MEKEKKEQEIIVKEAINGVVVGILMMTVVFLLAHFVFDMPFFP
ncbi:MULTISPECIES: hypothetical protein [Bacillaceae]|nr:MULTISPECIES: hypothetical protein [Bacillaceae]